MAMHKQQQAAKAERRLEARRLLDEGVAQAEVARRLKVSRQSVSVWARLSASELAIVRAVGRKSTFKEPDRQWLRAALLRGARANGFATDLWTLPRVAQTLALKRAKRFSKVHVWRILGQLGFSCQKPEGRARERNEPAIRTWKQEQWPALKKKP